jgi:hypothetical protein
MPRIAKRTNRTREEQRPPRLSPPVNPVILASLGFVIKRKPAPKPVDIQNSSNKKQGASSQNSLLPANSQPTTNVPLSSKNMPSARGLPEAKKVPDEEEPLAAKETAKAKVETEDPKPLVGRKRVGKSQPPTRKSTPPKEPTAANDPPKANAPLQAKSPPNSQQSFVAKEQSPDETPAAEHRPTSPISGNQPSAGPQPRTDQLATSNDKPGIPKLPTSEDRRFVTREEPKMKDLPASRPTTQAQRKDSPPSQPVSNHDRSSLNTQTPPDDNNRPGTKTPGMNGSAASTNGGNIPKIGSGVPANGNGKPTNGSNTPGNGNGSNGSINDRKYPGVNGRNGNQPRSSLFRPGAFATLPVVRIPPKAGGPIQKPPTQIPMESNQRPDEQHTDAADSGSSSEPQKPAPLSTTAGMPSPSLGLPKQPIDSTPDLEQILKQNKNIPTQAVVFGVCEDGLPMLLDLQDPEPGAVVVIGDQREMQLELLRTAVTSLAGRNSPRSVQFLVFSCEPESWKKWITEKGFDRHCLAIENADEEPVREWILRLADWTEQRRLGQSSGPSVLLIMDTLSFLPQLEYDVRLNFDWMAKEGPPAQIWSLAVISTELAKSLNNGRRLLRGFQTRIIGYANQSGDYVQLAGLNEQEADSFGKRGEFAVKVGDAWLRFKLPRK